MRRAENGERIQTQVTSRIAPVGVWIIVNRARAAAEKIVGSAKLVGQRGIIFDNHATDARCPVQKEIRSIGAGARVIVKVSGHVHIRAEPIGLYRFQLDPVVDGRSGPQLLHFQKFGIYTDNGQFQLAAVKLQFESGRLQNRWLDKRLTVCRAVERFETELVNDVAQFASQARSLDRNSLLGLDLDQDVAKHPVCGYQWHAECQRSRCRRCGRFIRERRLDGRAGPG